MTMSAAATRPAMAARPPLGVRVENDAAVPGVQQVVEPGVPAPGAVRPPRRLHLHHPRPGQPEQVRAQRPGPQRTEVGHQHPGQRPRGPDQPRRSRPHPRSQRRAPAPCRAREPDSDRRRGRPAAATGPAARPSNPARRARSAPVCARSQPHTAGHGSSPASRPASAPSSTRSSGRAQDTAAHPSAVGSRRHAPPGRHRTTAPVPRERRPLRQQSRPVHPHAGDRGEPGRQFPGRRSPPGPAEPAADHRATRQGHDPAARPVRQPHRCRPTVSRPASSRAYDSGRSRPAPGSSRRSASTVSS